MHLKQITISRFRSCKHTVVDFQKELTVLVGENNGGKSNIIDALRLHTQPLNGRRERYAEDTDIRYNSNPKNFEITSVYDDLSDTLKGLLITAVPNPTQNVAVFGCRYESKSAKNIRGKFSTWAGKFDTAEHEAGSTDLIRHVYLPPLRDAQQALGSGSAARVMTLLRHFLTEAEEEAFIQESSRSNSTTPSVISRMNTDICEALSELTSGVRPQTAEVGFSDQTINDIARDLRFKLGDMGTSLDDIRASGLGYANLLYIATVLVELSRAKEADLTLFLVEEPEAHLHPQLQMLVLEFLLEKAKQSYSNEVVDGHPEGRIQVIVSTHSPNLTAWVPPEHLVAVRSKIDDGDPCPITACVPIAKLNVAKSVTSKIQRYLDVTRSAMLFGSKVALIEGIAEALLLTVIAKKFTLKSDKSGWLKFKGTVLAPIDGVDFQPYLEILLRSHNDARIADKVVIITDADPTLTSNRKSDLESFAQQISAGTSLHVFTNTVTLEHELYLAGNKELLRSVFLELHPRSQSAWDSKVESKSDGEQPQAFVELLESSKTRKGDFAQALAQKIEEGSTFYVPSYLDLAIKKMADA